MADIPIIERPLVVGERLLVRATGKDCAHLEEITHVGGEWFECKSGTRGRLASSVFAVVDDDGEPCAVVKPPVIAPIPASANPVRPLPDPGEIGSSSPRGMAATGRRGGGRTLVPGRAEFYQAVRKAVDSGEHASLVDAHQAVLAAWKGPGATRSVNSVRNYFCDHGWRSGIMTKAEATRSRWERQRAADAAAKAATEPAQPPCSPPAEPVQPPCKPAAEPAPKPPRKGGSRKWADYWPLLYAELAGGTHACMADARRAAEAAYGRPGPKINVCCQHCNADGVAYPTLDGRERYRRAGLVPSPAAAPRDELSLPALQPYQRAAIDGAESAAEAPAAVAAEDPRRCRVCGCTDDDCHACIERTGEPCHWVEDDLCSACQDDLLALSEGDLPMQIEGVAELLATLRQCHSSLRLAAKVVAVMDAHKETEVA